MSSKMVLASKVYSPVIAFLTYIEEGAFINIQVSFSKDSSPARNSKQLWWRKRSISAHTGIPVEKESCGCTLFPQSFCYMRYKLYKFSSLQSFLICRTNSAPIYNIGFNAKILTDKVQSKYLAQRNNKSVVFIQFAIVQLCTYVQNWPLLSLPYRRGYVFVIISLFWSMKRWSKNGSVLQHFKFFSWAPSTFPI